MEMMPAEQWFSKTFYTAGNKISLKYVCRMPQVSWLPIDEERCLGVDWMIIFVKLTIYIRKSANVVRYVEYTEIHLWNIYKE